jgi:DNA-binding SARP family transcriptional activator
LKEAGTADNGTAGNGTATKLLQDLRDVDFLPGWYEDWVLFEQSRLRHDQLRAFTLISHRFADAGDYGAAADAAVAALELEPLYESAVRVLITSELAQGNLATALLAFDRYEEQLQRDMGVTPSEGLRHLMSGIRPPAPSPDTAGQEPLVAVLGGGVVGGGAVGSLGQQPLMHNA